MTNLFALLLFMCLSAIFGTLLTIKINKSSTEIYGIIGIVTLVLTAVLSLVIGITIIRIYAMETIFPGMYFIFVLPFIQVLLLIISTGFSINQLWVNYFQKKYQETLNKCLKLSEENKILQEENKRLKTMNFNKILNI